MPRASSVAVRCRRRLCRTPPALGPPWAETEVSADASRLRGDQIKHPSRQIIAATPGPVARGRARPTSAALATARAPYAKNSSPSGSLIVRCSLASAQRRRAAHGPRPNLNRLARPDPTPPSTTCRTLEAGEAGRVHTRDSRRKLVVRADRLPRLRCQLSPAGYRRSVYLVLHPNQRAILGPAAEDRSHDCTRSDRPTRATESVALQ
jgi:hypothetical protein